MNYFKLKQRLKDFLCLNQDINLQKKRLQLILESNDKNINSLYTDIEKEISDKSKAINKELIFLNSNIAAIKNPEAKLILQLRYLHLKSWNEVNEFMYNRHDDFYCEKNSKYERRMFRLHNEAIKNLSKN